MAFLFHAAIFQYLTTRLREIRSAKASNFSLFFCFLFNFVLLHILSPPLHSHLYIVHHFSNFFLFILLNKILRSHFRIDEISSRLNPNIWRLRVQFIIEFIDFSYENCSWLHTYLHIYVILLVQSNIFLVNTVNLFAQILFKTIWYLMSATCWLVAEVSCLMYSL